jgi:DNA (cytosine-5)-methyltransferase 1
VITSHYYNDHDPYCCQWLRNLIDAGEIPPGDVDTRSITDVRAEDLDGYTQAHFFCGIGGWPLALRLAGWPPTTPVWTGSCPCQPFSAAGKGLGEKDPRHLWPEFLRLIRECKPPVVFGEQVASKLGREWLAGVRADLETLGYAVGAADLCAASVGAPHIRQRLFWVADSNSTRHREPERQGEREEAGGTRTPAIHSGGDGNAHWLGDATPGGLGIDGCPQRDSGHTAQPDAIVGLGNNNLTRLEGRPSQPGDHEPQQPDAERAGGVWADSRLVHCRDGKTRRISAQPGNEPLAHGIPRDLGRRFPQLARMVASARANRVGRLRGYGNAIVPEVAATFIRAYMEARSQT